MYNTSRLEALAAVFECGSFEGAAKALGLTPSAVSQRVAALERASGHALCTRTRPVSPTKAGRVLRGLAEQVALLTADAEAALRGGGSGAERGAPPRFSLAINADSLATWFWPVVERVAKERSALLDLRIENEDRADKALRDGEVMAAVSTSPRPSPGCDVRPLGSMAYLPVCAPVLLAGLDPANRHPARLPMLRQDPLDDLQHAYLRQLGVRAEPRAHLVPTNQGFLAAIRAGLGWGVLPEAQAAPGLAEGTLTLLDPDRSVGVALHLRSWRVDSPTLRRLRELTLAAARVGLAQALGDSVSASQPRSEPTSRRAG